MRWWGGKTVIKESWHCSRPDSYSHLAFDVFFKKLFIHCVHLDLVAIIVVVNHVGAKLWGALNRAVRRLRVPEALRVFVTAWKKCEKKESLNKRQELKCCFLAKGVKENCFKKLNLHLSFSLMLLQKTAKINSDSKLCCKELKTDTIQKEQIENDAWW